MLPLSRQSLIRNKLAEYLVSKSVAYEPDISWLYYSDSHSPALPPMGAVICDRFKEENNFPFNLDSVQTCYKIRLRLLISKDDLNDLWDALDSWCDYLKNDVMRSLQVEGYEDLFQGIHLDPKQEQFLKVDINQDDGGTGQLHLFYAWDDNGKIGGVGYQL